MWLGRGKHFLVFPVRAGHINYVGFVRPRRRLRRGSMPRPRRCPPPGIAAQLRHHPHPPGRSLNPRSPRELPRGSRQRHHPRDRPRSLNDPAPAAPLVAAEAPAASLPESDALLDSGNLAQLEDMAGSSGREFIVRLLGLYVDHAPKALDELSAAVA